MRLFSAPFLWAVASVVALAPFRALAQEPAPAPPPTQSQSGYPDIRREAADQTLFPNPDDTLRNQVNSARNSNSNSAVGRRNSRGRKVGSRSNDQMLGQADADPLPIRVAYRRAKTLVMERNPNLRTLLIKADLAESDVEKRQYLRAYYTQLFADVRRIDSSPAMKSHLTTLGQFAEQRYDPKRRAVTGEEDLVNGRTDRRGRSH